jgi:hypothetical protein
LCVHEALLFTFRPSLLKAATSTGFTFFFYEQILRLLSVHYQLWFCFLARGFALMLKLLMPNCDGWIFFCELNSFSHFWFLEIWLFLACFRGFVCYWFLVLSSKFLTELSFGKWKFDVWALHECVSITSWRMLLCVSFWQLLCLQWQLFF